MNLAYIAGFVDSEGCIGFSKCRSSVFPRVLITNTNRSVLESIKEQFGGDIKPLALRKEGWKQGYSLRICWSRAVSFLDKIKPWLLIKSLQAETVFAWDAIRPRTGKMTNVARAEYQDAVDLLRARMTWLNKKGENSEIDPIEVFLDRGKK